jgi:hypothetical protein
MQQFLPWFLLVAPCRVQRFPAIRGSNHRFFKRFLSRVPSVVPFIGFFSCSMLQRSSNGSFINPPRVLFKPYFSGSPKANRQAISSRVPFSQCFPSEILVPFPPFMGHIEFLFICLDAPDIFFFHLLGYSII